MKRSEIFFSVLLLPVDFFALLASFVLSYYIRDEFTISSFAPAELANRLNITPGEYVLPFDSYLHYLSIIIPALLVIFGMSGLYTIRSNTTWFKRFLQIFLAVSVGVFFILLLFLLKKDFFLPRATIVFTWILGTLFVFAGRLFVRAIQKFLYTRGIGTSRISVIGKNQAADAVIKQLSTSRYNAHRLVSHLDSLPVEKLIPILKKEDLDELIVVSEQYNNEELIALRNFCLEQDASFSFVPSLLTELPSNFGITPVGELPMIEVQPTPLEGWGRVMKRAFDIVVGLLLILLFSPLFIFIAVWLKIASPGPLIYKHRRIGKNNLPIDVWKFRSMKIEYSTGQGYNGDAYFKKLLAENPELAKEWERDHKLKNDPRVSAPGKLLRKTSLDELPQFFNVLTGKLSLVGPRPIVEDEVKKYGEKARILFTVKPGVTGLWQVSGRNDISYDERISLDAYYIEHWSIWQDIIILIKTGLVLLKKGAGGGY